MSKCLKMLVQPYGKKVKHQYVERTSDGRPVYIVLLGINTTASFADDSKHITTNTIQEMKCALKFIHKA